MDHFSPERYLSTWVRERIEQPYDARVNEQAKLENLIYNRTVKSEPKNLLSAEIGNQALTSNPGHWKGKSWVHLIWTR